MEAFGLIISLITGAVLCAVFAFILAIFIQWAGKIVLKRQLDYMKMYAVALKCMLIGYAINFFTGQFAVMLGQYGIFLSLVIGLVQWLGLYSLLFGMWIHGRRGAPIGFKRGLYINLVVTGFALVFALPLGLLVFVLALAAN